MNYVDLVAMAALLQYLFFATLVGQARGRYKVAAPAVTGSEPFERIYRVQMNTLELLVAFLPALYASARYWSGPYVAALGVVYMVGRFIYWRAYVAAPASRSLGFALSFIPAVVLILAALAGALRTL